MGLARAEGWWVRARGLARARAGVVEIRATGKG